MKVNRTTLLGVALAIFAGALWLYWPSVHGGFLAGMDDDEYLRQAIRLKGLTWDAVQWAFTSTQPYYHPLPRLSHLIDYQIWGTNAKGHHVTGVVLHALNTALVFGFLWTLLGVAGASSTTHERWALAIGVAVVFAIHPLQVETVAWMSGRTQLLCTAFGVGSLWVYVAGARRWIVWALFIAALLSKPMAVSLPFAMLALDYFLVGQHEKPDYGELLRRNATLMVVGVAAAAATIITESRGGGLLVPLEEVRLSQRILLTLQSLMFYPWKLVWPPRLSPFYPRPSNISLLQPFVFVSLLGVVVFTALCLWRGRRAPALLAAWGAYVIFILPVSGLMQTGGQAVADRYAYIAMLPLLLLAGGAAVWLWRRSAAGIQVFLVCLLMCELGFFGLLTQHQIAIWHDDETLWRYEVAQFPNSDVANWALVKTLLSKDRVDEALAYAQGVVTKAPERYSAHENLGNALLQVSRLPEAIEQYEQVVSIKPDFAEAHNNLGSALERLGKTQAAIGEYEQAVRIKPDYAEAHCNMGIALRQTGRVGDAIAHYEQALRIRPDYAQAHNNLGTALRQAGRVEDAIDHYKQALRLEPGYVEAYNNLAMSLFQVGKLQEAIGYWEDALRIKPEYAEAHNNLGLALVRTGNIPEAIGHFEQALQIRPDYADAHFNLGFVLENTGKREVAIAQYQQALRIKPDYTAARNGLARLQAGP
jgi:tetratricopeptide (TPR) repeat protein